MLDMLEITGEQELNVVPCNRIPFPLSGEHAGQGLPRVSWQQLPQLQWKSQGWGPLTRCCQHRGERATMQPVSNWLRPQTIVGAGLCFIASA